MPDSTAQAALETVSKELGVPSAWLSRIIAAESGFDPTIKNPYPKSSSRGLLQFTTPTAQDLGFRDSLDLVEQFPTVAGQIMGPVRDYFLKYTPYPTKQSFYLAVFYPPARFWPSQQQFPKWIQEANKQAGIRVVQDYIDFVDRGHFQTSLFLGTGALLTVAAILIISTLIRRV